MNGHPIVIDTDPGIDDALAIMLAAASPEVDILGIVAVAGNVGIDETSSNAAALADLLRLDCPVGRGASAPMRRRDVSYAPDIHGENGLGGFQLPNSRRTLVPGVALLARLVGESPEPVTVVAIGPLTNLALLLNEHPDASANIERIVIMGGGAREVLGNVTPAAEFNIWFDPDAAALVFASGVPLTMVGLNATHQALVGRKHLPQLFASSGPVARIVGHLIDGYHENDVNDENGMPQHDSLAMAAVLDPKVITSLRAFIDVEDTGRLTAGMTVVDEAGRTGQPNCEVAIGVDVARFRNLLDARLSHLDTLLRDD